MLTFLVFLIWLNQTSERAPDENSAALNRLFWITLFLWPIGGAVLSERYLEDPRHQAVVTGIPVVLAVLIYVYAGFAIYLVAGFVIAALVIVTALLMIGRELSTAEVDVDETP
jgi:hypothetical protein